MYKHCTYDADKVFQNINRTLANAPKKYASRYYQLKVGHGAVGTIFAKIGKIETPKCWWCKEPVLSVEHLYAKCRRWRKERKKLVRDLEKVGIMWRPQAERKWLAGIYTSKGESGSATTEVLKSTEVGGTEGAREIEAELERRNDLAGEDLLEEIQEGDTITQRWRLIKAAKKGDEERK